MGYIKLKNIVTPQRIYKLYLNKQSYQKESDSELRKLQEEQGVTFVDMVTYEESQIRSIAILYLDNLGSAEDEMLCHSISDKMIEDLKKVSSIRSPSFDTVQKFRNSDLPLSEIARRLNVENIVSGSVLKSDDKLKVRLEMLNTATGELSWSEAWEGSTKYTGTMNGQMISSILENLDISVPEHIKRYFTYEMTENAEANELYAKGRHTLEYRENQDKLKEAEKYFVHAIELDDQFVEAYANLAIVYQWMNQYEKAEEELESALELAKKSYNDPGLAYIHNLLGIFYKRSQKYPKAIRHFEKGLELNIQLQDRFGEGKVLQNMGGCYSMLDADMAQKHIKKAIDIYEIFEEDLAMANALAEMGLAFKNKGEFSESLECHNRALGMYRKTDSIFNEHRMLFVIYDTYIKLGMYEKTSQFFDDAKFFESNFDDYYFIGRSYIISSEINTWKGDLSKAEDDLHEAIYNFESAENYYQLISLYNYLSCFYLELGKLEKASKTLRKSERLAEKHGKVHKDNAFEVIIFRVKLIREFIRSTDGDSDKGALDTFLKYLNKHETNVEDWWILSECYKYSGDIDKSKELLESVQKIILNASNKISNEMQRDSFLKEQIFNKKVLDDKIFD